MNPTTPGVTFRRRIKAKLTYSFVGILISTVFLLIYLIRSQFDSAGACLASVILLLAGFYVDVQFLRGHWRTWPYILTRFYWAGLIASVVTLSSSSAGLLYILYDQKFRVTPFIWIFIAGHWSLLLCFSSKRFHTIHTDSYTLLKDSN
ncbi:unnamed protein product [Dicrocoelium dendriticum]|nr:unnamed protein product [Dicrocoelium dendriticum]